MKFRGAVRAYLDAPRLREGFVLVRAGDRIIDNWIRQRDRQTGGADHMRPLLKQSLRHEEHVARF